MQKQILFTNEVAATLDRLVDELKPSKVIALVDSNTATAVYPTLSDSRALKGAHLVVCPAGECNKNLNSLTHIWQSLVEARADRRSVMVCIGGGLITDIGGFAAATFKRGIPHINIPTTLLGAVDASVGGKTGIDFLGLKNEIGAFKSPVATIVSSRFFATLSPMDMLSGYGEMLKHALLSSPQATAEMMRCDITDLETESLLKMVEKSVRVKEQIVAADPLETGLRKTLNLGHTFGHAFESLAMQKERPVAHGIAAALILSHMLLQFPSETMHQVCRHIKEQYPSPLITCKDYDALIDLMRHDKKNENGKINFTLLKSAGEAVINQSVDESDIRNALDIFQDLLQ
ncbi:MAG: 3-dehydroquinate synthase [Muribaculaceae bacterium]|nr:3-dehydroquinate synthase [Muribaculaceae bacterium]